jgi:Cu/Ag efflux pump CusA
VGGLFTSTLLTLFILPAVYLMLERRRARRDGEPSGEVAHA